MVQLPMRHALAFGYNMVLFKLKPWWGGVILKLISFNAQQRAYRIRPWVSHMTAPRPNHLG
jgi:hypothetical protein